MSRGKLPGVGKKRRCYCTSGWNRRPRLPPKREKPAPPPPGLRPPNRVKEAEEGPQAPSPMIASAAPHSGIVSARRRQPAPALALSVSADAIGGLPGARHSGAGPRPGAPAGIGPCAGGSRVSDALEPLELLLPPPHSPKGVVGSARGGGGGGRMRGGGGGGGKLPLTKPLWSGRTGCVAGVPTPPKAALPWAPDEPAEAPNAAESPPRSTGGPQVAPGSSAMPACPGNACRGGLRRGSPGRGGRLACMPAGAAAATASSCAVNDSRSRCTAVATACAQRRRQRQWPNLNYSCEVM